MLALERLISMLLLWAKHREKRIHPYVPRGAPDCPPMLPRLAAGALRRPRALPALWRAAAGPSVGVGLQRHLHATPRVAHGDFEWEDPHSEEEVVRIYVKARDGERTLLFLNARRKRAPSLRVKLAPPLLAPPPLLRLLTPVRREAGGSA